eukprot:CAMPEP_0202689004 /NCGR_PEP_ID=MMETSP1385-20130828/4377_1 /ASSEMBLY_ACC=CAM_ASM_000861 /TAXON_ID=933848 /ORGANISM="Elphidium margaritaceum" /LENGTH=1091 /DNA_ID=CAMNT_0049344079 /DNA_START=25 /DNA_END=3300 /DNA_ORIENTATION=-
MTTSSMRVRAHALCVCAVILLQCIASQTIDEAVENLSDRLQSLFCDGLSIGGARCENGTSGIQDFVDSLSSSFASDIDDASVIAEQVISDLDSVLNTRASFLTSMAEVLKSSCETYGDADLSTVESIADVEALQFAGNAERDAILPSDVAYSTVYGQEVSTSSSVYRLPNDVDFSDANVQRDIQISALMESTILGLRDDNCYDADGNDLYCTMYFGSINGVFRIFPASENAQTDAGAYRSYDPRFRPWYVSAASGQKDVIILMDTSGSMREEKRMELAKEAVKSVLRTLGESSYVSVIAFNSVVQLSCFEYELVPATQRNVAELISFVDGLFANGGTNFEAPFTAAFDILDNGARSCQTSILFLTDGEADDVSDLITARNNADINAVIFSYTLGSGAIPTVPEKVAELTDGIYTHIEDGDSSLATVMSSYYIYYAFGDASQSMVVSAPYLDFSTGLLMVTMAMPVYIDDAYFIGVVGTDIPLTFLSDAIGDVVIGRKSYSFVVNDQTEAILHPLIPNPLTAFFSTDDTYNAVFIENLEPAEFDSSVFLNANRVNTLRTSKISTTVKQPAGDVTYAGYIDEEADLLYFYAGVGPVDLSLVIVVFTESTLTGPNVRGFGLDSAPTSTFCDDASPPLNCASAYTLFNDLDLIAACRYDWSTQAEIVHSSELDAKYAFINHTISLAYGSWYLQPEGWQSATSAIADEASCQQLNALYQYTNIGVGSAGNDELPFGGFRSETRNKLLNSILTMSELYRFWKPAFLDSASPFYQLYFGSYQGLSITYPAKKYNPTFNALKRPWYQRAISNPELFVLTTPYADATSGVLVASGATVITAAESEFAFGVAAFDYTFESFLQYWSAVMDSVCSSGGSTVCYLIDSSAFLLYYQGIANDQSDEDISRKFLGDLEPTLMESLVDRGFFQQETNVNYLSFTQDVSYLTSEHVYETVIKDTSQSFTYNSGAYEVHRVTGTNLFVVYITNYGKSFTSYPDDAFVLVAPGCLVAGDACISAIVSVCETPDSPTVGDEETSCGTTLDTFGLCVLKKDARSDLCASNFKQPETVGLFASPTCSLDGDAACFYCVFYAFVVLCVSFCFV